MRAVVFTLTLALAACHHDAPPPTGPRDRPPTNGVRGHENIPRELNREAELRELRDRACACEDATCAAEVRRDHDAWTDRGLRDTKGQPEYDIGDGEHQPTEGEVMDMGELADDLEQCLARYE